MKKRRKGWFRPKRCRHSWSVQFANTLANHYRLTIAKMHESGQKPNPLLTAMEDNTP